MKMTTFYGAGQSWSVSMGLLFRDAVTRIDGLVVGHLNRNIDDGLLHRAFSVFLFTSQGKLLLQQRSEKKITFPLYWANTCCSHPLYTDEEMDTVNAAGVKRAAIRKLGQELGISPEQLPMEKFHYLTRIHYVAKEEGKWGEHEIDHILVIQQDVDLNIEPNEVKQVKYVDQAELEAFLKDSGELISPWFGHIQKMFLGKWWKALEEGKLEDCVDLEKIYKIESN
mmetsp:Transcript_40964/g.65862  ORF Transcript_40964/g.65862 Transcript_40964/m.65862 type:complete len:225 (-) Transcript_40964:1074-1748(-)